MKKITIRSVILETSLSVWPNVCPYMRWKSFWSEAGLSATFEHGVVVVPIFEDLYNIIF